MEWKKGETYGKRRQETDWEILFKKNHLMDYLRSTFYLWLRTILFLFSKFYQPWICFLYFANVCVCVFVMRINKCLNLLQLKKRKNYKKLLININGIILNLASFPFNSYISWEVISILFSSHFSFQIQKLAQNICRTTNLTFSFNKRLESTK